MTFTPIPFGTRSWHTPLNASLQDLQDQIDAWRIINVVESGATGDGVTDDITAITSAVTAASAAGGGVVYFPHGNYAISTPISVPTNVILLGDQGLRVQGTSDTAPTSVITLLASFAGAGAIVFPENSSNQRVRQLNIDGDAATGTVAGISASGYVHDVFVEEVHLYRLPHNGMTLATSGGSMPYSWTLTSVTADQCGNIGFSCASTTDTTFVSCEAIGNSSAGFFLNNLANSHFVSCRAEFNGASGFNLNGAWSTGNGAGGTTFVNCSTDRNSNHGFSITSTGTAPITINGCMLRRDGSNGTGNAISVSSATTPVIVSDLSVYPGVNDDGGGTLSPITGVVVTSSTSAAILSGLVHAATTTITDGGGNAALFIGPNILRRTGSVAAPATLTTTIQTNSTGLGINKSPTAPVDATSSATTSVGRFVTTTTSATNTQPVVSAVGADIDNRAFGAEVAADTFFRYIVYADGLTEWGSGSGARDVTLYRSAANVLATDDDFSIGTAGKGIRVAEGANAKMGTAVLVAGAVTVPTTAVTASSRIYLTSQVDGGTPGFLRVSARVAATSFTITSSNAADTSTVAWMIVEPA